MSALMRRAALVGLALAAACGSAPGSLETVPPTIVDFAPADGTTVAAASHVQITFSERMSSASVAVTDGTAAWDAGPPSFDPGRTKVSFPSPPAPLGFSKTYRVTVSGKDLAGNALAEPTSFTFATGDQPAVALTPESGATNVARTTRPKVAFNQAMDRASVEAAFSIACTGGTVAPTAVTCNGATVACTFAWEADSTGVSCVPAADFPLGANVVATLDASARSALGDVLGAPATASFAIEPAPLPPQVIASATVPANGATTAPTATTIAITFSKPMDLASAQAAFSTNPFVAGAFAWDSSETVMTFKPGAAFAHGTAVTWTVSTAAKDKGGLAMTAAATGGFHVVRSATQTLTATLSGFLERSADKTRLTQTNGTLQVGDSAANGTQRAFVSFNLASLSNGATLTAITSAVLSGGNLGSFNAPLATLGRLMAQSVDYGPSLGTDDFDVSTDTIGFCPILLPVSPLRADPAARADALVALPPKQIVRCSTVQFEIGPGVALGSYSVDVTGKVASDWGNANRAKRSQFRFAFDNATDSDGADDWVRLGAALDVTYEFGW